VRMTRKSRKVTQSIRIPYTSYASYTWFWSSGFEFRKLFTKIKIFKKVFGSHVRKIF
jgi:hypothetical protein